MKASNIKAIPLLVGPLIIRFLIAISGVGLSASATGCSDQPDSLAYLLQSDRGISNIEYYFTFIDEQSDQARRRAARDRLIEMIDQATESVELWFYGFDEQSVIDAVGRAKQRGLSIHLTGSPDEDYRLLEIQGLYPAIRAKTGIQHVKLAMVDRRLLFSGTGNFTNSGFFHNHNAFIVIPLRRSDADRIAWSLNHEGGNIEPIFLPDGNIILFSPGNGRLIQQQLVQSILGARHEVRYLAFSHTDPVITDALYVASANQVVIEGIYDDAGDDGKIPIGSEIEQMITMPGPGARMIYLEGNRSSYADSGGQVHGGHLHHKTAIIDRSVVLTGSFNWSLSARDTNMEIFFILHEPGAVVAFTNEFLRIRDRAQLLALSPFFVTDPPLRLFQPVDSAQICLSRYAPGNSNRVTIFSGRGPYFRAEHYRFASACFGPLDRTNHSAGLFQTSGEYPLPVDLIDGQPVRYQINHQSAFDAASPVRYPCERPSSCFALEIARESLNHGWIALANSPPLSPDQLIIWGRNGFEPAIALTDQGNGYFKMERPFELSGDLMVFFSASGKVRAIGCLQSGTGFAPVLENFLSAVVLTGGRRPVCFQR